VTISAAATQNMNCSEGICSPTAANAVLNTADLETMLASGSLQVTTTGSGIQADDISVAGILSWSNANSLALDAFESITVQKRISVTGPGGLSLTTNDGGSGGLLLFEKKGRATFADLASPLTINGVSFALENSIKTMASAIAANPSGAYALADSYSAAKDGSYARSPIPTTLIGTVQGLGNTISNLTIEVKENRKNNRFDLGLIQDIGAGGTVASINLTNANLFARSDVGQVGVLTGNNGGTLFDDRVSGSERAVRAAAGGLAGYNASGGTILRSSADVDILFSAGGGGLVAGNFGAITESNASGLVRSKTGVTGAIAGGLVGDNEGDISESYATGAAIGYAAGGLVGLNETNGNNIGSIDNSYSRGRVKGAQVGGLVSADHVENPVLQNSYSTGPVQSFEGNNEAGGFACGVGEVSDGYWDTTTSGTTNGVCGGNEPDIVGLTTEQLQSGLPAGFDSSIWTENPKINDGLPYLINNPPERR